MNTQRPVNLDLRTISLPVHAAASILHRVSGAILWPASAALLWLLHMSLVSPAQFEYVKKLMDSWFWKTFLWVILALLIYHFCAGIRHLLLDIGWGESLTGGRRSARLLFAVFLVLSGFAGLWLYL